MALTEKYILHLCMLKAFRIIGFLEGLSFIGLIGIGVPLKYLSGNDSIVKVLGMPHGILFLSYLFFALIIKQQKKWSTYDFGIILIAAFIPFGTFYTDHKYLK